MKSIYVVLFLSVLSASVVAEPVNMEELRMQKRFGIGLSAAGPLSVMGIEIDMNLTENLSISGGIGTGLDYSTFMVKGRYFLLGEWVSPYLAVGMARWWTGGAPQGAISPAVLANRFLEPNQNLSDGFSVFMIYPAVGVQFMHVMGVSFFAEVEYLFKLMNFSSGTYAGLGMHWYF